MINRSESALIAQERRNQASRGQKNPQTRPALKAAAKGNERKLRTSH